MDFKDTYSSMNKREGCIPASHHFTASPCLSDRSFKIFCRSVTVSANRLSAAKIPVASPSGFRLTVWGRRDSSARLGSTMIISLPYLSRPHWSACIKRAIMPVVLPDLVLPATSILPDVVKSISTPCCTLNLVGLLGRICSALEYTRLRSTRTSSSRKITLSWAVPVSD